MTDKILALEASSPEELNAKLNVLLKSTKTPAARFAALAVSGPQVLVRPFELVNVPLKEVKTRLKFEAIELLGLPADEVEFDYQLINPSFEKMNGVFACIPKKLLMNYIQVLDRVRLIPVKIIPNILACLDSFLSEHKISEERFCYLDFTKAHLIHLAIFEHKKCEILREIPYENAEEAKREVIQSLRSACAKSAIKTTGQVFISGDWEQEKDLSAQVEKEFSSKIQKGSFTDIARSLSSLNNFFTISLSKNYTFNLPERKQIMLAVHVVIIMFVIYSIFLNRQAKMNDELSTSIKDSYTSAQVSHAKELKKQVAGLEKKAVPLKKGK